MTFGRNCILAIWINVRAEASCQTTTSENNVCNPEKINTTLHVFHVLTRTLCVSRVHMIVDGIYYYFYVLHWRFDCYIVLYSFVFFSPVALFDHHIYLRRFFSFFFSLPRMIFCCLRARYDCHNLFILDIEFNWIGNGNGSHVSVTHATNTHTCS